MSYIDDYRNRVSAGGGTDAHSQIAQTTMNFVNQTFADSPFYDNIPVDNVNTDVRILTVDGLDTKKTLTFRPQTVVNKGAVAVINSESWLCMQFDGTTIFPKGEFERCNATMKWISPDNVTHSYPAFSTSYVHKLEFETNRTFVTVGDSDLYVMCPYDATTKGIKLGMRFFIGQTPYTVFGVDDVSYVFNGTGMMFFAMKLDTIRPTDDVANGIADNSNYYLEKNKSSNGQVKW